MLHAAHVLLQLASFPNIALVFDVVVHKLLAYKILMEWTTHYIPLKQNWTIYTFNTPPPKKKTKNKKKKKKKPVFKRIIKKNQKKKKKTYVTKNVFCVTLERLHSPALHSESVNSHLPFPRTHAHT